MGIDRTEPVRRHLFPVQPAVPGNPGKSAGEGAASPRDRIDLSAEARDLAGLDAEARAARVREIRDQVDAGTYTVEPDDIAGSMVQRGDL